MRISTTVQTLTTLLPGFLWLLLSILGIAGCAAGPNPGTQSASEAAAPAQTEETRIVRTPTTPDRIPMETPPTDSNLSAEAGQTTYLSMELADKTMLQYAVALPDGFDPSQPYPILLALPPGGQDRAMVEVGFDRYWTRLTEQRGWIVLSPIAPNGVFFFQGSERLIPEFLERTSEQYQPEGGKYHLAGISNGGLSGFRIALSNPDLFHSLTVLPGFPPTKEDSQKLAVLKDIPVAMFVGEQDTSWAQAMQQTQRELTRLGGQVSLEIIPGEGHVIQSLTRGEKLFDLLDSFRRQ